MFTKYLKEEHLRQRKRKYQNLKARENLTWSKILVWLWHSDEEENNKECGPRDGERWKSQRPLQVFTAL